MVAASPALAALCFELGLGDRVVGVSAWTRLPAGESRPVVADALSVDTERLLSVRPDAVLTQTDDLSAYDAVRRLSPRTRVEGFRLETLEDIRSAARRIGALAGCQDTAAAALARFDASLDSVRRAARGRPAPRTLFAVGANPPLVAGPDTFMDELLRLCGSIPLGNEIPGRGRWRATDLETVLRCAPDVLICHCEPGREAATREYWMRWKDLPAVRNNRIRVISDPAWLQPSLALAAVAEELFRVLHDGTIPAP